VDGGESGRAEKDADPRFREDSPHDMCLANQRLGSYLSANGLDWVMRLRSALEEIDLSLLTGAYSSEGRKATHPRVILGLIVYGMLQRQWSLRELEDVARRDLGAWWICGGIQPDHSTIGKFIRLHADALTEEFFTTTVRYLVGKLRLKAGTIGGDGTIIEAAGAKLRRLKLEAAKDAVAQAAGNPAENAQAIEDCERRAEQDRARGRGDGKVSLCVSEPSAVVQPCKDGRIRAAYKPSIWVHESGLIIGQFVHPCSESAAIQPLLKQHREVFREVPLSLLLDAGYNGIRVIRELAEDEIDALIPSGKVIDGNWTKPSSGRYFPKSAFHYDTAADVYHCPAGNTLLPSGGGKARGSRPAFRSYRGRQCGQCVMRAQCTSNRRGRMIQRYEGEELREAMAEVLAQPRAREKYRQRAVIAEPPFAEIKHRQGLARFHRRGPRGVRVEFALHCLAFNLKKTLRGSWQIIIAISERVYSHAGYSEWQPVVLIAIFHPSGRQ
jgi:transposase